MCIHYNLRPKNFSSGLILLAELAEEYWRDLAAVPASWDPASSIQPVWVCVYIQHQVIKPFCSLENVSSCKKKKLRRRMLKTMEKKSIFIFTGRILLLFCSASSVCKIAIALYRLLFRKIYLWIHDVSKRKCFCLTKRTISFIRISLLTTFR